MTTLPNRSQVDRAPALAFVERDKARQELTITITARINGFDCDLCFSGQVEQLDAITKRLLDLGAMPSAPAGPAAAPARKPAQRVEPVYNGAGDACCPKHNKVLKEGQYGLYCPAKDDSTDRGYCALKFKDS